MSKKISKSIKPLLAVSLCCAITLQNVTLISNANEIEVSPESQVEIVTPESVENQEENLDNSNSNEENQEESTENQENSTELPETTPEEEQQTEEVVVEDIVEDIQQDPGRLNMGATGARSSALPNLDIVQLKNPNAIGSGKLRDTDFLNVRSGPSTSYDKIGTLNGDDSFEILGTSNGWYKIDFNGKEGFISPVYVTLNALDKGIDVSKHNGKIDWQQVKASGVSYAIIRAGYGTSTVDERFHENIQGALNAGLKVGVYWFSYATSVEKAQIEAQKCLETIAPYQGRISYPVFHDFEYASVDYANKQGVEITKDLATDMAKTFINTIKSNGYVAGIYTNGDFGGKYFHNDVLYSNNVWSAQYGPVNKFNKPYSMWQYSDKGSIPGMTGAVDLNYTTLKTFDIGVSVDPAPTPTPDPEPEIPTPPPVTSETGTTTANLNFRTGASTSASIITTIKKGSKVEVIDKSVSGWYKINYNGSTGYVSSEYVTIGDVSIPTPPPTTSETGTTTANVNFRTGASTSASIITTIKKGSKVEVIDKNTSGWYKINYNGKTGYVSSQYVTIGDVSIPTPPPTTSETGVTTENVNFRTGASTSASKITTIRKGTKVEVIDKSVSGWYKVNYNGRTGYVSSQYVSLNGGGTTTPPTTSSTGTTTENLNLRKGPSTSSARITTIKKGSKVEILDKSNSAWFKVKFSGKTGYVSSEYIR